MILGIETIILWNSDLWCVKEEWFLELLKRHNEDNSVLSGTKLVYPPEEMSLRDEKDTKNIRDNFMHMSDGKWRETIQFGGDYWINMPKGMPLDMSRPTQKDSVILITLFRTQISQ